MLVINRFARDLVLVLGLVAVLPAAALPESLGQGLSLEAKTGFLAGTSHEIVYLAAGSDTVLSQLDWNLKPLVYYGLAFGFGAPAGFYGDISLRSGLSGRTGDIMDSDYLNTLVHPSDTTKTNLSVSDNYTEDALLVDAALGWRFKVSPSLALRAYGGLEYMHYKFTARDGYLQYGAYNSGTSTYDPYSTASKEAIYGTGIILQQDFLALSLGLGADYALKRDLTLKASLLFSPAVSCTAFDNHVERYLDFTDTMSGGWLIEPKVEASWAVSRKSRFDLSLAYRLIKGLRGDEVAKGTSGADFYYTAAGYAANEYIHDGDSYSYTDTAGAAFEALDFGLSLSVSL